MKRVLIIATAILISLMLFNGIYYKDAPLMWLASTSVDYAYMRVILIIILVALFVSTPPRSTYFRLFLSSFALALFGSAVWMSMTYAVNLLDAVVFIEVAIIFMLEALEGGRMAVSGFNSKISSVK